MHYDVVIIGGGIVGLATAYQLLQKQPQLKLVVLEKEATVAAHQTGHNSGVIHSGIYYKPGSQKALNCIKGYGMLLDFCQSQQLPYEVCGKIIVATNEQQLPQLQTLFERGQQNGLTGLQWLDERGIKQAEPHAAGIAALWVPQTGITDYKTISRRLVELIQQQGGQALTNQKVIGIQTTGSTVAITTQNSRFEAAKLVNCAGLYADRIARLAGIDPSIQIIPFRGEYYHVKPEAKGLVRNLIYPVPDPAFPFLGVHFTRGIDGSLEAGPNAVLAYQREGYHRSDFNASELKETLLWPGFRSVARKYWRTGLYEMYRSYSKAAFTKALQQLVPAIKESDLLSGGAGVRAQACDKEGKLLDDFLVIQTEKMVHVLNAPSPAATSSLSIGEAIAVLVVG